MEADNRRTLTPFWAASPAIFEPPIMDLSSGRCGRGRLGNAFLSAAEGGRNPGRGGGHRTVNEGQYCFLVRSLEVRDGATS